MATKSLLQRETKKKVIAQLEDSLQELKSILGEKKFSNRIKKAAKLLTEGIETPGQEEKAAEVKQEKVKQEKVAKPVAAKVPAKKSAVKKKAAAPVKKITKAPAKKQIVANDK